MLPTLVAYLAGSTSAQELDISVGPNVLVAREAEGRVLVEPHLAAHPTDPGHLIGVGWVTTGAGDAARVEHCAVLVSRDSGRAWARSDLPGQGCGDPWISMTVQGTAVLTSLDLRSGSELQAHFSSDGGKTWSAIPQDFGGGHDGTRNIAAPDGTIYVLSGQPVRDAAGKSRFGILVGRVRPGRPHIDIMPRLVPSNLNLNSDGMVVLSDGSLLITYTDFQRPVGGFRTRQGVLKTKRTWAMRSTDGGASFSIPMLVTDACYARPTFLAVDASNGPYRDRIYHVCDGDEESSVLFTSSGDRGEEWLEPRPIEPPATSPRSRTSPQLAVNGEGVLGIAWTDHRDDPTGRCYAPYFAASGDGGRTFSRSVRIAEELSCPDQDRIGRPARRWPEGGDYFGLAAGADGRFHLLWPDARTGVFELWSAAVTVAEPKKP